MGNSPSKSKNGLSLSRTDTGSSAKSGRSVRSRLSTSNHQDSPKVSRKNSSASLPTSFRSNSSAFDENGLHASMAAPEPDKPILLRRNTNDTEHSRVSVTGDELAPLSRSSTNHSARILSPTPGALTPQHTGGNSADDRAETMSVSSKRSARSASSSLQASRRGSSRNVAEYSDPHTHTNNVIDIEDFIQRLLDAGYSGKRTKSVCLKNEEISLICAKAREIFLSQPSLLELSSPVKVVGDVHGQYSDLIRIFTKCGFPPSTNYLFLGDYVDRGKQSLETILLLLCYKIKYPENFFLLRGNHECANVTRVYGFYDECKRRCNIKTWKLFIDTFNTLPIAAIVAGKIFCVHGGLSPVLNSMDEIRNIARPTDVPDFGLLNDLLWSDPADTINEWEDNERGVSYVFSKVAINKFLSKFGFDLVCRAHMVVEDGYEFFNDRTLVTVFSAPNYCGEFDNWGAVMSVSEELLCSFELLDPLDSVALKQAMRKGKHERRQAQSLQQSRAN
ncbi:putative serine threonine-phosphatase PP-Z1 [Clavispora lusitaniae]|uniref:Serine/threonine-protein phosphatase n=3 Tax=Clavispora lusitaniae TaxID=36911 RepID=C4XXF7_CLAL4|nr:uncharacterized protein CLUG_00630 [Clavispora lusitaniae ATCC 42720]KAF5213019.1 Serine/threonine-protein phosphatase [Clavispora lusitaniae]EEQ36507.1 hypothetical protein CLUG_00630 [Clavispora lusitaniae ATCC 42720]OVF06800.1 putative serine/threonine-protein phosphatase [Clavispora lusitaniae]QFZ25542.1 putative serine threonine-phosphatase PP-Z1 [Clavispora lusitaniae]QFZ31155.1 putative serine threonine-phosphatase PP-Z1 [Clavispora lusitaniae]